METSLPMLAAAAASTLKSFITVLAFQHSQQVTAIDVPYAGSLPTV